MTGKIWVWPITGKDKQLRLVQDVGIDSSMKLRLKSKSFGSLGRLTDDKMRRLADKISRLEDKIKSD